ncbi:hypothetical protein Tco_0053777 [Tanacetum coccineum]
MAIRRASQLYLSNTQRVSKPSPKSRHSTWSYKQAQPRGAQIYVLSLRPPATALDFQKDIVHATCYCACYHARPTEKYLKEVKRIFWYLKYTINMGLWYLKDTGFKLTGFLDSDHAGCLNSRKSTSGDIQFIGGDKLVRWSFKKQDCTLMYTAEADYVSLSTCCAQVLWLRT